MTLDKDHVAGGLTIRRSPDQSLLPDEEAFHRVLNWAYAAALMIAKAVARDGAWSAKLRDQDLNQNLLQIVEWDHRARYGPTYDTRHAGVRMQQWMDPDVQADLVACWGPLDLTETAQALVASVDLLTRLATRAAAQLNLKPFDHQRLRAEIDALLSRDTTQASPAC